MTQRFLNYSSSKGTLRVVQQNKDVRHFQAILPIRGKILNVEKQHSIKILANEEIRSLFTAMGTGFGGDFDLSKARYQN